MVRSITLLAALFLLVCGGLSAAVIDFDSIVPTGSPVPLTTEIAGLTFTNASVLTAGINGPDAEFPPSSGLNYLFDDGGPLTIVFDSPVSLIRGRLGYLQPVTLTAFSAAMGGSSIGSDTTLFQSNSLLGNGDPASAPSEVLELSSMVGIRRVVFTGNPAGGSFVLDDLEFEPFTGNPVVIPEPTTTLLLVTGGGLFVALRRRK